MNKEDSKTVQIGDEINLVDISITPGRSFSPILGGEVTIERIFQEVGTDYLHFDIGMVIGDNQAPLKSRDTGEEIDGSDTYWMHPLRFEFIK